MDTFPPVKWRPANVVTLKKKLRPLYVSLKVWAARSLPSPRWWIIYHRFTCMEMDALKRPPSHFTQGTWAHRKCIKCAVSITRFNVCCPRWYIPLLYNISLKFPKLGFERKDTVRCSILRCFSIGCIMNKVMPEHQRWIWTIRNAQRRGTIKYFFFFWRLKRIILNSSSKAENLGKLKVSRIHRPRQNVNSYILSGFAWL